MIIRNVNSSDNIEMIISLIYGILDEVVKYKYMGAIRKSEFLKSISPSYKKFHNNRSNGMIDSYIRKYPKEGM